MKKEFILKVGSEVLYYDTWFNITKHKVIDITNDIAKLDNQVKCHTKLNKSEVYPRFDHKSGIVMPITEKNELLYNLNQDLQDKLIKTFQLSDKLRAIKHRLLDNPDDETLKMTSKLVKCLDKTLKIIENIQ
jgi:hypothetical protein